VKRLVWSAVIVKTVLLRANGIWLQGQRNQAELLWYWDSSRNRYLQNETETQDIGQKLIGRREGGRSSRCIAMTRRFAAPHSNGQGEMGSIPSTLF